MAFTDFPYLHSLALSPNWSPSSPLPSLLSNSYRHTSICLLSPLLMCVPQVSVLFCFFLVFVQVWCVFFPLIKQRMCGISSPVCLVLLKKMFPFCIHFTSNDNIICFFLNVWLLSDTGNMQHSLYMCIFCRSCDS